MTTSIIKDGAKIGKKTRIGEFCIIYPNVEIGDNCVISDHVIIGSPDKKEKTIIGPDSIIRSGSVIYHGVKIGKEFRTGHNVLIRENTTIGENSLVGTNSVIDGNCKIGNKVSIQTNAYITWGSVIGDKVFIAPCVVTTNDLYPPSKGVELMGPVINDGATVGANSILLPGVVIGKNAVVGAGAVVTKDVQPGIVVIGIPARAYKKEKKYMDEVTIIFGTRPQIIKLSTMFELLPKHFDVTMINTGQHYDYEMDAIFFEELKIRQPDFNLNVGKDKSPVQQIAEVFKKSEALLKGKSHILVEGDTNSTLCGALLASKMGLFLTHIEAGCRSFTNMQEENNRVVTDHLSDLLCAPTQQAVKNLKKEGIPPSKIHLTGPTIVDVVQRNIRLAKRKPTLNNLGITNEFVLATIHRAESVNSKEVLYSIISGLDEIAERVDVILPIHPHTQKMMREYKISLKNVRIINPLGYLDFINLLQRTRFVITDSGGIQEEAAILHVPCLTVRNETEWPETVKSGANILVGKKKENIIRLGRKLLEDSDYLGRMRRSRNPFVAGASQKIISLLKKVPNPV